MDQTEERDVVRRAYSEIASKDARHANGVPVTDVGSNIGYSADEMASVPDGANLGLGCGNPLALEEIAEGDVVLDLGSGAGFDCFLAAQRVGPTGRVIGVDMTPEMLERARRNAATGGYTNVEFRHGDLEAVPVADNVVDLVISNCVISLVPDRAKVYREAHRVLRPGGRFAVSDTLVTTEMPPGLEHTAAAKLACLTARGTPEEYVAMITAEGFQNVMVVDQFYYPSELAFEESVVNQLTEELGVPREAIEAASNAMLSLSVVGRKPEAA